MLTVPRLAEGCCVLARAARLPRVDALACPVDDIAVERLGEGPTSDCGGCMCVHVCKTVN